MWIKEPTDQFFEVLDQVITQPVSRATSERNLLAQILRANGVTFETREVDPDRLYRGLVFGRNDGRAKPIAEHFTVLAYPGEPPQSPLHKGDILLRVTLGHPGLGHVSVIVDPTLWPHKELAIAPFGAERQQPGFYVVVCEAGAYPHPASQPFARCIFDAQGKVPQGQILIRLKRSSGDSSADFPLDDEESSFLSAFEQGRTSFYGPPENIRPESLEGVAEDTPRGQPTDTLSVTVILDQPAELGDKFQLVGGSGSYSRMLGVGDAEPLVAGEKIIRFKVKSDKKGYKLIHHRSKGMKRTIFLETRLQDMTEAGYRPQTGKFSYYQTDSQIRMTGPEVDLEKDLVQPSPVWVDLRVEDPEL